VRVNQLVGLLLLCMYVCVDGCVCVCVCVSPVTLREMEEEIGACQSTDYFG
jgi:hypothetical protein